MAARDVTCLVCGRPVKDYDAAPRLFCSVGCEADAGPIDQREPPHPVPGRGQPVKTHRPKETRCTRS
jgi:hypothetical protein